MTDDSLRSLLAQYGLEGHAPGFGAHGLDLAALAAADDDMAREFADALRLNIGDRAKLIRLCRDVRDGRAAAAGNAVDFRSEEPNPAARAPNASTLAAVIPPPDTSLEEDLVAHLPTPIARAAHALMQARDPLHLAEAIETVVDTMLRFLALVCKADYLAAPAWYDARLNDLFPKLDRPQLGVWKDFIDRGIAGAAAAGHQLFLSQLRDTWTRTEHEKPEVHEGSIWNDTGLEERRRNRLGRLEWLVNLRNAFAHNKVPRRDVEHCVAGREVAIRSIRDYGWLREYELWASDGKAMLLLQGLNGQAAPGGPSELRRNRGVSMRRRSAQSPTGRRSLEMPPLIVSDAMITSASQGVAATALLFGGISGPNDVQYSAPDAEGGVRPVRTTRHLADLRRRQAAKRFPRIGRADLDYAALLDRTKAATDRTLRILEETQKYRRELHVERHEYEPRLAQWIDSPVPLLGIAAEAGAGKTGILASLVHRWRESSDKPVLFLLARDFQSMATIDRVIRETLMLADDVTAGDVAAVLTGLVVVVDGLNEHPNRIDLLDGIRGLARNALERHAGPRFAISWRTEDAAWMENALSESSLWWMPSSSAVLNSIRDWLAANEGTTRDQQTGEDGKVSSSLVGRFGEKAPSDDAGIHQGDGKPGREDSASERLGKSRSGLHKGASADSQERQPFVTVKSFEEHEVAAAWERYRTLDPQRMAPRFEWQRLREECPELAWDLRNPLRMRIAMECYHERELPAHLRVEEVFETYLDSLRGRMRGVADLLAILGEMMLETRQNRFEVADLERRGRFDLVYAGSPMSAFDFLVRAGMLSVLDEQGRKAFTFTVERVAEQVLGEHIAALPDAETADSLARLANDIPGEHLILGPGAIRVALRLRVATQGRDFLYDFIDAQPLDVGRLAAGALADLVVSAGEAGAASIAEELLGSPTSADFEAAANTADFFARRDAHAVAIAFLDPFVATDRLVHVATAIQAGNVAVKYVLCRIAAAQAPEGSQADRATLLSSASIHAIVDALRRLASLDETACSEPLCEAQMQIGATHKIDGRHEEAAACFRECCSLDAVAINHQDDPLRRRRLAVAFELLGTALRESGKHDEALDALREAIQAGTAPSRCPDWSLANVWANIANVHRKQENLDAAIDAETRCLEEAAAEGRPEELASTLSRIGDLHTSKAEHDKAIACQQRAVGLVRDSGNRTWLACTLQWLGNSLRESGQHEEALAAYRDAIDTAMNPARCVGWSHASVLYDIVLVHSSCEDWGAAIEAENAVIDACLAEGLLEAAARGASWIGVVYADQIKDREAAVKWQRRSVEIARDSGDRTLLACSIQWLGNALRDYGNHDEALEAYREAISTGTNPDRCPDWSVASVWWEISATHRVREEWQSAIEAEKQGMEACVADQALEDAASAASRIGDVFAVMGQSTIAIEWQRRAVELASESGNRLLIAHAYGWLANATQSVHLYGESIEAETKCLDLCEAENDLLEAIKAASRIGDLYDKQGNRTTGLEWHRRAVALAHQSGSRTWLANALQWLGTAQFNAGHSQESLESFQQSLDVGMTPEQCPDWRPASVWSDISSLYSAREDWGAAIDAGQSCFELCFSDKALEDAASTAFRLGNLFAAKGDRAMAIQWMDRGVAIYRDTGNRLLLAAALTQFGDALRESLRSDEAIDAYCNAMAIVQNDLKQCPEINAFVWSAQLASGVHLERGACDKAHAVLMQCEPHINILAADLEENHVDTAAAWWERMAEVQEARGDGPGHQQAKREASRLRERLACGQNTKS